MSSEGDLRKVTRQVIGVWIYRGLLNIVFLTVAFQSFPGYESFTALGFLVFNQGIASLGTALAATAAAQNFLDDIAERKTRHTILLARDEDWRGSHHFWAEVDRRVDAELGDRAPALRWWASAGRVLGAMLWRLFLDLATITIASMLAA